MAVSVYSMPRPFAWCRLLVRCLHPLRNALHAHSSRSDLAVPGRRCRPRHRVRVVDLGGRTDDVEAASQQQPLRLGDAVATCERAKLGKTPRPVLMFGSPALGLLVSVSMTSVRALVGAGSKSPAHKKQGRRRSITLTALPAPDIEIGLRHPVNWTMPRDRTDICDPFHNRRKIVPGGLFWGGRGGRRQ